ncbi:hypothetical protein KIH74_31555 [Kineosporia sp. J2-2]|uniref:DUF4274 domain-containing protein n=1 Tax=Kineosporia corallincola TaxID=2835133 RepID=A0ABS5TRW4_9ACTN|nr:hypothetical protein [Kineosporia corallincola]MBT0773526.1 hypothetical protein [Kineosporia corallincola]
MLDGQRAHRTALAERAANFEKAWAESPVLTPRQASAIAVILDVWADLYIGEWLKHPSVEPLHEVEPFASFDVRVMIYVNENRAWAEKARERCRAVSDEIESGTLPFDRPGCYFDELLMAAALPAAQAELADMPEMFDDIAPRVAIGRLDDGEGLSDDDWDLVADSFDDQCRWDEWEVPLYNNYPLLGVILASRHPFTWFDPSEGTGPGYLRRLVGLEIEKDSWRARSGPTAPG